MVSPVAGGALGSAIFVMERPEITSFVESTSLAKSTDASMVYVPLVLRSAV